MSRILLLADAGSTTGFARVSHSIGDRLIRDYGHEIHCLAVNYDGDPGRWDTLMKLYLPTKLRSDDQYGTSRFIELLAAVMPDVIIMINDPYVIMKHLFKNKYDTQMGLARSRPIIAYMPIDGTNQPPIWARIPDIVASIEPPLPPPANGRKLYPVAMTKYGQAFLGGDMVYHGVDHDRYRPVSPADPVINSAGTAITSKAEAKAAINVPEDALLVLRVDRNSHRKNFGDTWRAMVPIMKRHPKVYLWLHCQVEGDQLEILQLIQREPDIADRIFYPGKYHSKTGWPEEDLITLYNAADIFVSTSWGEGFGLTLAEAAACEIPIVAQNVASIPEVVGPGGILLKPERLTAVESGQDQWLPDVRKFTIAIERLVASAGERKSLGEAGRKHVVSTFSWDAAAAKFDELITRAAQENPVTPAQALTGDIDEDQGDDEDPDGEG